LVCKHEAPLQFATLPKTDHTRGFSHKFLAAYVCIPLYYETDSSIA